ncbi:hypothetical protein JVT61DRAFT_9981 [Boletus reticuloceps]|uniref:RING-type E3 ubiquitin transferase n=1 Tax=Boletus reticuloceps TaxID=495285 RepID=A0A8I3AEJ3_9AGAM|nr:hypothetical protein JVT61DRAFT_9981 [Boletus reticuloceps]
MSSSSSCTANRNRKSIPCRLYSQGQYCRFGDKCKFSHDGNVQLTGKDTHVDQPRQHQRPNSASSHSLSSTPSHDASDARPRPKRKEIPCRAWKAGTCTKGSKCWFAHDVDVHKPGLEPHRSHQQKHSATSHSLPLPSEGPSTSPNGDSSRAEHNRLQAERARTQEAEAVTARERANDVIREQAAKTISHVVFGSIVTFSAGLDVSNLTTGFETCTLRIGNLPLDVKEDDIHTLLRGQGLDVNHFHLVTKKKSDRPLEAHIITDIATGRALAVRLDGVEFQDETLVVEMSATNSLEGMSAATGQSSETLTISWHAPSARYIAEYADVATAKAKVGELHRLIHGGRRIKVEMNAQLRGCFVPNLRPNAIKINNLPPSVTDEEVIGFTGSISVKRLATPTTTVEHIARLVRGDIERAIPGGLRRFEDPPNTCTIEGVVHARAHFSTWDEAHTAHTRLSQKRYGNQPTWFRLPDPMYFTLVIPPEQYKAQKAQWDSLLSSIKDRKACTLNVRDFGNAVSIRLSGSVKEATGALKVRVENLARGDKVEGWHRSLGISGNPFVSHVYSETGAYLRADWKRQSLKVYGAPRAVDNAREMIKGELDRLAALDYTVTIARHSMGFFVREGIQQLKETLGEDNVRFAMSTRKITVSGGEEARHALDRLITLSHKGSVDLLNASQGGQTCPICYDSVSSPHQLGCGHTYCVACLRHFVSSALDSDQLPLTCLGDETQCRVPIAIPIIQQFLPPASFNRLLETAFDVYIAKHPEEFKHCKTPDCTQIYRAVQAGTPPETLHCPSCFSAVCNGCHEDVHDGLSCAQSKAQRDPAEQERLNDAWIASQNGRVKKCPRCSVLIEKIEGCNHMTCRCGAHICWRCMGIFSADTIYDHMNDAHGTIHGDAAAVPNPFIYMGDIEEQRELLRQAEVRRHVQLHAAPQRNAIFHDWDVFDGREDLERLGRLNMWQRQREAEEQVRLLREQRLRQEAEQRRREQEREDGGWCMIM